MIATALKRGWDRITELAASLGEGWRGHATGTALDDLKAERDRLRAENDKLRGQAMILPDRWREEMRFTYQAGYGTSDHDRLAGLEALVESWRAPGPPRDEMDWYPVSRAEIQLIREATQQREHEADRWRQSARVSAIKSHRMRERMIALLGRVETAVGNGDIADAREALAGIRDTLRAKEGGDTS